MRRTAMLLLLPAGAILFSPCGFDGPPPQATAGETGAENAPADEPKDQTKSDQEKGKAREKGKDGAAKVKPKTDVIKTDVIRKKAEEGVNAAVDVLGRVVERAVRVIGRKAEAEIRDLVVDDNVLKQFEQQFGGPFKQLLRSEMHFIRVVCRPTKQQYGQIEEVGEKELKATIRKFALLQQRMRRGLRRDEQLSYASDPRKMIAAGLMRAVKTTLSAEQAARYQTELDRRDAARKRVALLNLLAKLDKELVLTAEQRGKLSQTLNANWQDNWSNIQMVLYMSHQFPELPDHKVLPILTEAQKDVWRGIPKQAQVFFGFHGLHMVQGIQIDDEEWDEETTDARGPADDGTAAAKPDRKRATEK